ncbi:hypothetical protein ACFX1S_046804 [Malus domestica]
MIKLKDIVTPKSLTPKYFFVHVALVSGISVFTNLACPVGPSLPLISFSVQEIQAHSMASNKKQAMTINATSIEKQLVQMKETIARLIKTTEEKNLQTTGLINRLEAQHGVKAKPSSLPTKRTEEGLNPNAYELMSKAGHDFVSSSNLGKKVLDTVNDKDHDIIETQKKLEEHDYGVGNNIARLGFTPNAPVKISSKAKNASAQHISLRIEQDQEEP